MHWTLENHVGLVQLHSIQYVFMYIVVHLSIYLSIYIYIYMCVKYTRTSFPKHNLELYKVWCWGGASNTRVLHALGFMQAPKAIQKTRVGIMNKTDSLKSHLSNLSLHPSDPMETRWIPMCTGIRLKGMFQKRPFPVQHGATEDGLL